MSLERFYRRKRLEATVLQQRLEADIAVNLQHFRGRYLVAFGNAKTGIEGPWFVNALSGELLSKGGSPLSIRRGSVAQWANIFSFSLRDTSVHEDWLCNLDGARLVAVVYASAGGCIKNHDGTYSSISMRRCSKCLDQLLKLSRRGQP